MLLVAFIYSAIKDEKVRRFIIIYAINLLTIGVIALINMFLILGKIEWKS